MEVCDRLKTKYTEQTRKVREELEIKSDRKNASTIASGFIIIFLSNENKSLYWFYLYYNKIFEIYKHHRYIK